MEILARQVLASACSTRATAEEFIELSNTDSETRSFACFEALTPQDSGFLLVEKLPSVLELRHIGQASIGEAVG